MFGSVLYRQWQYVLFHNKRYRVTNIFTYVLSQYQFSWINIIIGMFWYIQLRWLFIRYVLCFNMYNRLLCIIINRMYTCWHRILFRKWLNRSHCMYEQTRKLVLYRLGRWFKFVWLGM